jgi:hypothetical protein
LNPGFDGFGALVSSRGSHLCRLGCTEAGPFVGRYFGLIPFGIKYREEGQAISARLAVAPQPGSPSLYGNEPQGSERGDIPLYDPAGGEAVLGEVLVGEDQVTVVLAAMAAEFGQHNRNHAAL